MRLIEEKLYIGLNIFSIIFILLTTLTVQIADYKIEEQDRIQTVQLLVLLQKEQFKVDHKIDLKFLTLFRGFGMKLQKRNDNEEHIADDNLSDDNDSEKILEMLKTEYNSGKIDLNEYTQKRIDHYIERIRKFSNDYNAILKSLQQSKPTKWYYVRSSCMILQFVGIFLLMFGYLRLFKLISNRVYKSQKA